MYMCVGISNLSCICVLGVRGHVYVCRSIEFASFYDFSIVFRTVPIVLALFFILLL